MNKEQTIGLFQNLLVIDPQEDCHCDTEIYDSGESTKCVWLRDGLTEIVNCYHRILLPMSLQPITFNQFKYCLLDALPYASPVKSTEDIFSTSKLLVNTKFNFDKLSKEYYCIIDHLISRRDNTLICLSEIPENHIYFVPDPEFLGVFTWNLSRHGMFIMANKLKMHVI